MKYIIHKKLYLDTCKLNEKLKDWTEVSQNMQDKSFFNVKVVYVEPIKVTQLAQLNVLLTNLSEQTKSKFIKNER
jgi:hypothetical protein